MGKKVVLVDDLDGSELPEDTKPVELSLGRSTYNLYLSDNNYGKLMEALQPFIENAETVNASARIHRAHVAQTAGTDKEKLKAVREWAQSTGFKYKNAKGEEVTLGDRGRIPQEVIDAYDAAN